MRSRGNARFWVAYRALPPEVRESAREAYREFRDDPRRPGLRFKKVHATGPIYSVRVTLGYRAVCVVRGDLATWFWIGTHAEYDRLLSQM